MKIAVCGSAGSSVHLTPVDDPEWQIWGCAPANRLQLKRADRWFELHVRDDFLLSQKDYLAFLKDFQGPVYIGGSMKIAICGSSHLSAHTTPETDDWQIWATSPGSMNQLKRADKWFEFHRWVPFIRQSRQFMDFLKAFKGPVYTAGEIPEIPNAVRYPIEEVEREFSSYFLTSSCALMMALAILEKPEVIGLFGIDMAERSEYRDQRPGAHFFILEALRRGIGIYVPVESVLLRPAPVYGFCEWTQEHIQSRLRSAQMSELLKQERKTIRESQARCERYEAMAQDLDYMINMWSSPYGLPSGKTIRSKDEN